MAPPSLPSKGLIGKCFPEKDAQGGIVCGFNNVKYAVNALAVNDECAEVAAAPFDQFIVEPLSKDKNRHKVTHISLNTNKATVAYVRQLDGDDFEVWTELNPEYVYSLDGSQPQSLPSCDSIQTISKDGKHVWKRGNDGNTASRQAKSVLPREYNSTDADIVSDTDIIPIEYQPKSIKAENGNTYTDFGTLDSVTNCDNGEAALTYKPYLILEGGNTEKDKLISAMKAHFGLTIPGSALSSSNSVSAKAACTSTQLGTLCGLNGHTGHHHNRAPCTTCGGPYCC